MCGRSHSIPSGNWMKTAGLSFRISAMPQHLFVYGTLRFEYPNPLALKLKSQAVLIGKGFAPGVLYDIGWYPGAVFNADSRTRVVGELYALWNAERLMDAI